MFMGNDFMPSYFTDTLPHPFEFNLVQLHPAILLHAIPKVPVPSTTKEHFSTYLQSAILSSQRATEWSVVSAL